MTPSVQNKNKSVLKVDTSGQREIFAAISWTCSTDNFFNLHIHHFSVFCYPTGWPSQNGTLCLIIWYIQLSLLIREFLNSQGKSTSVCWNGLLSSRLIREAFQLEPICLIQRIENFTLFQVLYWFQPNFKQAMTCYYFNSPRANW